MPHEFECTLPHLFWYLQSVITVNRQNLCDVVASDNNFVNLAGGRTAVVVDRAMRGGHIIMKGVVKDMLGMRGVA